MKGKTKVDVGFNGMAHYFVFNLSVSEFESIWDNHMAAVGYFQGETEDGKLVTINPTQCGIVEIYEA